MGNFTNAIGSFVKRNPGASLLSTVILIAGVAFGVKGINTNNGAQSYVGQEQSQTSTGVVLSVRQVFAFTHSGALALSGKTLNVGDGLVGTGRLLVNSTLGGLICLPNSSGVMKAIFINNATVTVRAPQGSECSK